MRAKTWQQTSKTRHFLAGTRREIEKTLQKPGRNPARRRQKTGRPDGPAKRGETSVEIKKRATENP